MRTTASEWEWWKRLLWKRHQVRCLIRAQGSTMVEGYTNAKVLTSSLSPTTFPTKSTTILNLLLPSPGLLLCRLMLPKFLRYPRDRRLRDHLLQVIQHIIVLI